MSCFLNSKSRRSVCNSNVSNICDETDSNNVGFQSLCGLCKKTAGTASKNELHRLKKVATASLCSHRHSRQQLMVKLWHQGNTAFRHCGAVVVQFQRVGVNRCRTMNHWNKRHSDVPIIASQICCCFFFFYPWRSKIATWNVEHLSETSVCQHSSC